MSAASTRTRSREPASRGKSVIRFTDFMQTLLDFQLKEHDKFLLPFTHAFKMQDRDNDGVLTEEEVLQMAHGLGLDQSQFETFLKHADPLNHKRLTYSQLVQAYAGYPIQIDES